VIKGGRQAEGAFRTWEKAGKKEKNERERKPHLQENQKDKSDDTFVERNAKRRGGGVGPRRLPGRKGDGRSKPAAIADADVSLGKRKIGSREGSRFVKQT